MSAEHAELFQLMLGRTTLKAVERIQVAAVATRWVEAIDRGKQ